MGWKMMRLNFIAIALAFGITTGEARRPLCWIRHKGTCQNYKQNYCPGGYDYEENLEENLCPENSDIRCCRPCNSCQNDEINYEESDSKCTTLNGKCIRMKNYCPSGNVQSHLRVRTTFYRLCGEPRSRRCCLPDSSSIEPSGNCTLWTYSTPSVRGHQGYKIRVESGFYRSMEKINKYARDCGVVVRVIDSFRKKNVPVRGAIVTPASRSNHKVGHAIDMNLQYGSTWCNSGCIQELWNTSESTNPTKCFITKIRNYPHLRWGGDFRPKSDPVHIDDMLNIQNGEHWDNLYRKLQRYCP